MTKHSERSRWHVSPLSVQSQTTGRTLNGTDESHEVFPGRKPPPTVEECYCTSTWQPLHLCGSAPLQLKLTAPSIPAEVVYRTWRKKKKMLLIFINNICVDRHCSGVAAVFEASSVRKGKLLCSSSLFLMNACAIVRVLKCLQGVLVGNSKILVLGDI